MSNKRMLSRLEIIKANELLKQHLAPSDREGYFRYQGDWSDARVAQELDPAIQAHSIGNLRTELFGKLDTSGNISRDDNGRVSTLETLVQNLLSCYGELEVKYNKLVDTLAINNVVNVKHLKTTIKEQK